MNEDEIHCPPGRLASRDGRRKASGVPEAPSLTDDQADAEAAAGSRCHRLSGEKNYDERAGNSSASPVAPGANRSPSPKVTKWFAHATSLPEGSRAPRKRWNPAGR